MRSIALGLTALIALAVPTEGAEAAPACSKRTDVLAELSKNYAEAPIAIGLGDNGHLLEVLASRDGTTWTIIQTAPTGISCLIAAGQGWQPKLAQFASADPQI